MPGAESELRGQGGCLHVRGACLGRRVRVVVNACPRLRGATLLGTDKGVGLRQRLPPHGDLVRRFPFISRTGYLVSVGV